MLDRFIQIGPAEIGAGHAQILFHGQLSQDAMAFRNGRDAHAANDFRAQAIDLLAVEGDLTAGDRQRPGDREDERAFAGSIGAQQRGDLAWSDLPGRCRE